MHRSATVVPAEPQDIPALIALAHETWWHTYPGIISDEQIRYMLAELFSHATLARCMRAPGWQILLLHEGATPMGFVSYGPTSKVPGGLEVSKLYVSPSAHGRGYGRRLIEEVCTTAAQRGAVALVLNVNRHNPAKEFYLRMGFEILREEDLPIGPYWMNDYVMRLELPPLQPRDPAEALRGGGAWPPG